MSINREAGFGGRVLELLLAGTTTKTQRTYISSIRAFGKWIGWSGDERIIERLIHCDYGEANGMISAWRQHMLERGLAERSVALHVSVLRNVARAARQLGYIEWVVEAG